MNDETPKIGSMVNAAQSADSARREVMVIGRQATDRAGATRLMHMRRLAATRGYVWPAVIGGGGLFLLGATTGKILYAILPLLAVLLVLGIRAWREATRLAARDFFSGFAVERRLNYSEGMMLVGRTPLLAAGERRRCEHYIEGPLGVEGQAVAVAHFIYETRRQKHDRRNRPIAVMTPHDFTVAIVDLQRASGVFPGLFVARRGRRPALAAEWIDRSALIPATLSNPTLAKQCDLLVRPGQDLERLTLLLRADLQAWLATSPLAPGLEFDNGTLLLYVPGRLRAAAQLDQLLDLTARIARRMLEAGEPLQLVDAARSQAPPRVHPGFPAPPPATKPALAATLSAAPDPPPPPPPPNGPARGSVPPPAS
jgi:hypothetical protein